MLNLNRTKLELSAKDFKELLNINATKLYHKPLDNLNEKERFNVLAQAIKDTMAEDWKICNQNLSNKKEVHYFSIEFLLGKQLKSIILNRNLTHIVNDVLAELNWNFDNLIGIEPEPAIANGGLGRLAACFIDSMACLEYAGYGQTIRYRHGLFKQQIVNDEQMELPDRWLENSYYPWDSKSGEEYIVKYRGSVRFEMNGPDLVPILENYEPVTAIAYDIPVPGFKNDTVNYLRTWEADMPSYSVLDQCGINYSNNDNMDRRRQEIKKMCEYLYPDDSTYEGKELRLKQEYFLCSAGVQSLIKKFKKRGVDLRELDKYLAIHINDTHPSLVIPELMRILMDEENLGWNKAWEVTTKVCSYTNHTIMQEALEVWPGHMLQSLLPRIYMIIQEIDRRYIDYLRTSKGYSTSKIDRMKIIDNYGHVRMANMDCMCCHSINGVAALHTEILKEETLHDFYTDKPEAFNNKTNGIAHRRWLISANPSLTNLFNNYFEHEDWQVDLRHLKELNKEKDNAYLLECLEDIKYHNKVNFIKTMNLDVNPDSIFDVQIKRIHMYKRQIMNVLRIMMIYNDLLENPDMDFYPMTFIMGGKAAASYRSAKNVIKVFNKLAKRINNDSRVNDKIKLVFIEDYNVSKAELIIPAADISEQIPTASKEASGTSNMKFMMNGALTLGTLDGANVEITEYVGEDNIFLFGLRKNEVLNRYANWKDLSGRHVVNSNKKIEQAMNLLRYVDSAGEELYWELMTNDHFFTLTDLQEYVNKTYEMNHLYAYNRFEWNKKCLINIANSCPFTTDRTITQYGRDIWFK
jgi:starch phosphorylase